MATGLAINGTLERGQDVRTQNTMACSALGNIVKSSLGPVGLDKMLVDEMGEVTITNDGATILKRLEVEHPAAKVLVELSNLQDQEVGDGTTSVVILAAELVKQGNKLVKDGVHPTQVISAYNLAKKEACKFIAERMATKVDTLGKDSFINAAKTSLSSKIITAEAEFFSKLAVDAIAAVKTTSRSGKTKYPVKAITILKAHGKSIKESELVNGYALNNERRSDSMPAVLRGAKIALLDFELRKAKMGLGVQVVVSDPKKLDAIRQREGDITKERIRMILNAGANVILTTKSMDDLAIAEFVEAKAMAFARVSKTDIRNIAKATGGTVLVSLADMEGAESVDSKMFGECDMVEEVKVGDGKLTYFKGCKNTKAQTIILRGANDYMLDEVDRSLHDSLCVVKRVLESNSVVPGGGCVESALAIFMEFLAGTMGSREQLGLMAFAEAMLVIPKQLAINGAHDATDLIAKLRSYHHSAQHKPGQATKDFMWAGLDLDKGQVRNNLTAGVLEPAISKIKMIRFATEAAVTILRIDDSIKMAPKDNPKGPVEDDY